MILRGLLALVWTLAAAVAAQALTVATYNVENYLLADRVADGVYRERFPKPESEKRALRAAIKALDADILALQEMGREAFLQELLADLRAEGVDYPHAVLLEANDPERHVAILSRLPFKDVRRHARVPVKFQAQTDFVKRGLLEVTVATEQGDLTVFTLHLKSRRTERPEDPGSAAQRAAEAEAVRDLVLTRFPDPAQAKFIVCGDWNDHRNSRPIRALTKRGDTVIGEILRATDRDGDVWTHFFRTEESYSRIDFLMVSPGLKPFVASPGQARILDGAEFRPASDHRAVYVRLTLQPQR